MNIDIFILHTWIKLCIDKMLAGVYYGYCKRKSYHVINIIEMAKTPGLRLPGFSCS